MSLESWKEEFYPVSATYSMQSEDDLVLVDHCLRKWNGALPKNRKAHGVEFAFGFIIDKEAKDSLCFNGDSCALCQKYVFSSCLDEDDHHCPIVRYTGRRCDYGSPYDLAKKSPSVMVKLLKQIRKFLQE
jgi:hypothetical protein